MPDDRSCTGFVPAWNHTTNKTEAIHCSALVHYKVHCNERNIICLQIYFLQYAWLWDRKNQIQFSTVCKVKYWWQHFFLVKDAAVHIDSAFYPVQWVIWDFPAFTQNIFLIHYTKIHFCLLMVKGFSAKYTVSLWSST